MVVGDPYQCLHRKHLQSIILCLGRQKQHWTFGKLQFLFAFLVWRICTVCGFSVITANGPNMFGSRDDTSVLSRDSYE